MSFAIEVPYPLTMNTAQLFHEVGLNPADYDDLHVSRMLHGFVAVSHGQVVKVTEPKLRFCPLVAILYDRPGGSEDVETVKQMMAENTLMKIKEFGHFTERRQLERGDIAVPYGASEMIMFALRKHHFDCAITVCDGAGTVLCGRADVVQGVGARMNGLFYTTPIAAVIRRLEEHGCVVPFPETAEINQVGGLRRAAELGHKRIAVTINGYLGDSLAEARAVESEFGVEATLIVVCTTGASPERVREIRGHGDVVWGCASAGVREVVGKAAIIQVSTAIPVFAVTGRGVRFLACYSPDGEVFARLDLAKQYLIAGNRQGIAVKMGNMKTSISECPLPARSAKEPRPLA